MSAARPAAVVVALALGACSKIDYIDRGPIAGWSPTVVLMHRGGGDDCGPPPATCWPNTLPAVFRGFDALDGRSGGAEVDIQISSDGTLWLGHDNEVLDCAGNQLTECFQNLHDTDIDAVAHCDGAAPCDPADVSTNPETCIQHYVRLEDVFRAISGVQPEKKISLDIKGQYCGSLGVKDAEHIADEVDRQVRQYGMDFRVLTETSQIAFQDRIKSKQTPVYSFWVSLGDVDGPLGIADQRGADGISFKWAPTSEAMDASVVAGIQQSGFRIILWTIDAPEDILAACASAPDVIETDAPDFFSHVASCP